MKIVVKPWKTNTNRAYLQEAATSGINPEFQATLIGVFSEGYSSEYPANFGELFNVVSEINNITIPLL